MAAGSMGAAVVFLNLILTVLAADTLAQAITIPDSISATGEANTALPVVLALAMIAAISTSSLAAIAGT
jgi:hypothetical protein